MNTRLPEERWFETTDGVRLFYRYWPGTSKQALVLLHRGHEHSGRLQHIVDELDLPTHAMFAWDARGHGLSPGARGDSPSLGRSVRDLDDFVRHIVTTFEIAIEQLAILAQSVGSVLATAWVHDYAPKIRGMVLAAPAFNVNLYVPFARPSLAMMHAAFGNFFVQSYVKARLLTHDPIRIKSYETDPLITRAISVRVLLGLYETGERVVSDAAAIHVPTQVLVSGKDWVVRTADQELFFKNLGSKTKELHTFPDFYHDTLGEKDRAQAITKVRAFLTKIFAAPPEVPNLLTSDQAGFTKDEFDKFSEPKPLRFAGTKWSMRTGGRLSAGIRLGLKTGFDSGASLDYVYKNEPTGFTPIGKAVDFGYLNAIGWRGIRVRKGHLEKLLRRLAEQRPLNIIDVAAGHGRYVLDCIPAGSQALLRDFDPNNVAAGRALIAERGLSKSVRFEQADAFDPASYSDVQANTAIISGLFELFPSNAQILKALTGLAQTVEPGGHLLYTGQPWHPQLEMIARTLPSHRGGKAWVMRRRSQAELDQLVESAGFRKIDQLIDDFGIFTVSLAERIRK